MIQIEAERSIGRPMREFARMERAREDAAAASMAQNLRPN